MAPILDSGGWGSEKDNTKSKFKKGLMLVESYDDCTCYRCACSCGEPDHDIYIDVEYDHEIKMLSLMFYKNIYVFDGIPQDILWFDDFKEELKRKDYFRAWTLLYKECISYYCKVYWKRLKKAMRVLFTGYIKMNESFIFSGEEQFDNFMEALEEGRKHVKDYEEKKKNKET